MYVLAYICVVVVEVPRLCAFLMQAAAAAVLLHSPKKPGENQMSHFFLSRQIKNVLRHFEVLKRCHLVLL